MSQDQEKQLHKDEAPELIEQAEEPAAEQTEEAAQASEEVPAEESFEIPAADPFEVPAFMQEEKPSDQEQEVMEPEDLFEVPVFMQGDGAQSFVEGEEPSEETEQEEIEDPEENASAQEEIVFHEIHRKKRTHVRKHYLMRAFMVLCVLVLIGLILMSPLFDIKKIKVEGNEYYTDQQVVNMSGAVTGENIFLHTHAGEIEKSLMANPYYTKVSVHRKLPDTLVIDLKERPQVASLTFGDNYVIIDDTGYVLRLSKFQPKLTLLKGLTLSRIEVGEKIAAEEKENLKTTLDMLHTMDEGDLYFREITIGDLNIEAYIYDMLMVRGRPDNVKKSIENGTLQKIVNKLYKSKTKRGIITVGDDDYLSFSPAF